MNSLVAYADQSSEEEEDFDAYLKEITKVLLHDPEKVYVSDLTGSGLRLQSIGRSSARKESVRPRKQSTTPNRRR